MKAQSPKTINQYNLSLAKFLIMMIETQDQIIRYQGFEINNDNHNAKDFFSPYWNNEELYQFQLRRYNNNQNDIIMKQNSNSFIVVEYIEEGRFLVDLVTLQYSTFKKIFFQLLQAIFELHKKNILARCISSQNVFFDPINDKVYLTEFGFSPYVRFNQPYKSNYDIQLIISILKDLHEKKHNNNQQYADLMRKLLDLEKQLPNLNEINSFLRLYKLVENGFSEEQLNQIYTDQWVEFMNKKIKASDFSSPIQNEYDSEQTDVDQRKPVTNLEFLQLTTEDFKNKYPQEVDQIGFLLLLCWNMFLKDETIPKQENYIQIAEEKTKTLYNKRIQFYQKNEQKITEEHKYVLKPNSENENFDSQRFELILKNYRRVTNQTYKKLFLKKVNAYIENKNSQISLEEARIFFLLAASMKMFDFDNVYAIYRSKEIHNKIQKISEIMAKYSRSSNNQIQNDF